MFINDFPDPSYLVSNGANVMTLYGSNGSPISSTRLSLLVPTAWLICYIGLGKDWPILVSFNSLKTKLLTTNHSHIVKE